MPYIEVQMSKKLSAESKLLLARELGKIIELVPGKSEKWIMTHIVDEAFVTFSGESSDGIAAVIVKTFGELEGEYYDLLTAEICRLLADRFDCDRNKTYVEYESTTHWGWDGVNF